MWWFTLATPGVFSFPFVSPRVGANSPHNSTMIVWFVFRAKPTLGFEGQLTPQLKVTISFTSSPPAISPLLFSLHVWVWGRSIQSVIPGYIYQTLQYLKHILTLNAKLRLLNVYRPTNVRFAYKGKVTLIISIKVIINYNLTVKKVCHLNDYLVVQFWLFQPWPAALPLCHAQELKQIWTN